LAGWDATAAETLRLASQMHDVGKIGIPDHILLKPGRFDAAERAIMERHSEIGARILAGIDTPLTVMARTVALTHHEKWDGSGYPNALAGEEIPREGRIAAICDVFDALLSSRPYKDGWPLDKVVNFMGEQAGKHFDPDLIAIFLAHLDDFIAIRHRFQDDADAAPALFASFAAAPVAA
jgi:putative two-component system response regulator